MGEEVGDEAGEVGEAEVVQVELVHQEVLGVQAVEVKVVCKP